MLLQKRSEVKTRKREAVENDVTNSCSVVILCTAQGRIRVYVSCWRGGPDVCLSLCVQPNYTFLLAHYKAIKLPLNITLYDVSHWIREQKEYCL